MVAAKVIKNVQNSFLNSLAEIPEKWYKRIKNNIQKCENIVEKHYEIFLEFLDSSNSGVTMMSRESTDPCNLSIY